MNYEEEMKRYLEIGNYRSLNRFVMTHTQAMIEEDANLKNAVLQSILQEEVIYDNQSPFVESGASDGSTTNVAIVAKRTFEAASSYRGKKVAVLNFANNHSVGGGPFSSAAQEETLCHASTLYPCLKAKKDEFHELHKKMYWEHTLDSWGNADIIYTPDVIVFKTDGDVPHVLDEQDRFKVDVITCAAPELSYGYDVERYTEVMKHRILRILSVAKSKGVEVLILGAFGCGAFHNPPEIVAKLFKEGLKQFHFERVEFAICGHGGQPGDNFKIFKKIFEESD